MSHPGSELQKGLFTALASYAPLQALIEGRVYDRVPPRAVFPYLTIGDEQLIDDGNTCEPDAYEAYVDVHVWTDNVGLVAGKPVAGLVREAVINTLAVEGWLVQVKYESERHFRDPDGLRAHGVSTFKILLEPAE